jgi:two-component system response regulator FixJ
MPRLSGLDLARRLKTIGVLIPIVFVTASADELRAAAMALGAVALLEKPFTGDALLEAIKAALATSP